MGENWPYIAGEKKDKEHYSIHFGHIIVDEERKRNGSFKLPGRRRLCIFQWTVMMKCEFSKGLHSGIKGKKAVDSEEENYDSDN